MGEWTPGPWGAMRPETPDGGTAYWWEVVCPLGDGWDYIEIAEVSSAKGRSEANARLIAAAPEMAELLERFTVEGAWAKGVPGDRNEGTTPDARALLARIKGESDG